MTNQVVKSGVSVDAPIENGTEKITINGKEGMHIKVYSPFQTYFDDVATSISGINDTGPFDILPHHHNFLTLLSPCDLIIQSTQGERRIKIARGIMHVKADKVIVFLDV